MLQTFIKHLLVLLTARDWWCKNQYQSPCSWKKQRGNYFTVPTVEGCGERSYQGGWAPESLAGRSLVQEESGSGRSSRGEEIRLAGRQWARALTVFIADLERDLKPRRSH